MKAGCDADVTLSRIEATLEDWKTVHGPIAALGIASFGPVDLNRTSSRYGFITSTAKPVGTLALAADSI
jgi:fructokinase